MRLNAHQKQIFLQKEFDLKNNNSQLLTMVRSQNQDNQKLVDNQLILQNKLKAQLNIISSSQISGNINGKRIPKIPQKMKRRVKTEVSFKGFLNGRNKSTFNLNKHNKSNNRGLKSSKSKSKNRSLLKESNHIFVIFREYIKNIINESFSE